MVEPYLSIVIPAYNEALRIESTLEKVRQYSNSKPFSVEVIVVDDGSTDGTFDVVVKFPEVRLLRNDRNHGKGFAVRQGAMEARGRFILMSDADLSAPIEEADLLLAASESSGADAAIGSRALRRELIGVRQSLLRDFAGRFFNVLVRLFTGLKIHDTQCGFKLFRHDTTRRAFELQRVEGFGFDPELLLLITRSGGKVIEVPVRWDNNPATKLRFVRDSSRMFLDLIVVRWRFLRGKYQ